MIYDLQKASLTKRLSAFLFDFILLAIVFTGAMTVISTIVKYDEYFNVYQAKLLEIHDKHHTFQIEEEYGISFSDYTYMTKEEKACVPPEVREEFDACINEIDNDAELNKLSAINTNLTFVIITFSLLIAFGVVEFAIPLFLKNGQTLGKKIFSLAVIKMDGVRISPMILFVRTILGKYTIGTMVPILMVLALMLGAAPIMPLSVLLLVLLLQIVFLITTKTNSLIHDSLASTVVVDFQSQMIFDSLEAKNQYILRIQNEKAENKQSADSEDTEEEY